MVDDNAALAAVALSAAHLVLAASWAIRDKLEALGALTHRPKVGTL